MNSYVITPLLSALLCVGILLITLDGWWVMLGAGLVGLYVSLTVRP